MKNREKTQKKKQRIEGSPGTVKGKTVSALLKSIVNHLRSYSAAHSKTPTHFIFEKLKIVQNLFTHFRNDQMSPLEPL